jgi:hypothetical protein
MPKEGSKMPTETFFTAISRWRVVLRRALDLIRQYRGAGIDLLINGDRNDGETP